MPVDYNNYPPHWKDRIRPDILKRDGYRCKKCGLRHKITGYRDQNGAFIECDEFMTRWAHENGKKPFRIILTVAHLCHYSHCDNYLHLVALCQRCHFRLDAPIKAILRKAPEKRITQCLPIGNPEKALQLSR